MFHRLPDVLRDYPRLWRLFFVATWLCFGGARSAVGEAEPAPTLTSYQQFLASPGGAGAPRQRLQFEAVVTYCDPAWKLLWGETAGGGFFLPLEGGFPIESGQRVRIDGWTVPDRFPALEVTQIESLGTASPVEPLDTRGRLDDRHTLHQRVVSIDGLVETQVWIDSTHLRLNLRTEGGAVTINILMRPADGTPVLEGATVRVRGVFVNPDMTDGKSIEYTVWSSRLSDVQVLSHRAIEPPPIGTAPGSLVDGAAGKAAPAGREPALIASIPEFWARMNEAQSAPHHLRVEANVNFYDPWWNQFWGDNDGVPFYLEPGRNLPVHAGQRVRIEGTVVPAEGLKVRDLQIVALGTATLAEPLETRDQLDHRERFHERIVWMDGYVEHQSDGDPSHVKFDFVVEGYNVSAHILLEKENAPQPQLEGALIRARGVYVDPGDPSGKTKNLSLGIARPEDVQIKGWLASDLRFEVPVTPIINLADQPAAQPLHVRGTVHSITKGRSIVLRDPTGQITLLTAQNRGLETGMEVDAVGFLSGTGPTLALRQALWRPTRTAASPAVSAAPAQGLPKLLLIEQILELAPAESERGYPVLLQGEVVWSDPHADFFFLLDASRGVKVNWRGRAAPPPDPFSNVVITGTSANGPFAPIVNAAAVMPKGKSAPPEARRVTLEQMLTGAEEAGWVEVLGYLRGVFPDGAWTRLEMTTAAGEFGALLPAHQDTSGLAGAVLRLQGVCSATANDRRQLTGVQLWVPSREFVHIEEPAPQDPFAAPTRTIPSLRQFGQLQTINRRVLTHGVVLYQVPGRYVLIQDGAEGLQVLSRDTARLAPGDHIEVVGFPGREGNRVVLREALYRPTALGAASAAVPLKTLSPFDAELDGRLVQVDGTLVQLLAQEKQIDLTLKRDGVLFAAVLDTTKGTALSEQWNPGSRLGVTGVLRAHFDESRHTTGFHVQLRSPEDVRVLARAPWWTIERAFGVAGFLAAGSALVILWVLALRRRVRHQTQQIREQMEQRAQLELELQHAARIESLGVLAGGIAHDFNNFLTVVLGNLSLAMLEDSAMAVVGDCLTEAERGARRARDLTQQLLTFAKGGSPVRSVVSLPEVVRESAAFAMHGAMARCEFESASDLWAAEVDKGQIGQVVHNLVLNALQAMPKAGVLRLSLANEQVAHGTTPSLAAGRYVRLTVADEGAGIGPDVLPRILEPYFSTKKQGNGLGLATVYSIVKKHLGHIEVESELGRGTTFHIWLPAALTGGAEIPGSASAPETVPLQGRALLMDDEASIRRLGQSALQRLGLEATTVSDGGEAVREIAAAHAAGRPYCLVIFDLTVPGGMGGKEALEKVRKIDPTVRAIVSSGYSQNPVMADFRAHGFDAVVPKPYEVGQLTEAVRQVLGLYRKNTDRNGSPS